MTDTGIQYENRYEMAKKFRQLPGYIEALVSHLNYEQLTTAYLEGEWTVAQNVHHLADTQSQLFFRVKKMLLENIPAVQPFEQDDWATTPEATSVDVASSISILRGLHFRWADLIESLNQDQWIRAGHHPETGTITVAGVSAYAAEHGYRHLEQINKTLAASQSNEEDA